MSMRVSELYHSKDRPAHYRAVVLHALERLSDGDTRPKTLHRARTNLRRLQAYLELVGEHRNADSIAGCVTRLSKLRTLQVFERYLSKLGAPRFDLKAVKRHFRARQKKLQQKHVYTMIERIVRRQGLQSTQANPAWLAERMQIVRKAHAGALRRLTAEAGIKPRRKMLHQLRLLIKSIRYQEEWALEHPPARSGLIQQLKYAQTVLGDYEDLAQFRKLARALDLRSAEAIDNAWEKARRRARALLACLVERLGVTRFTGQNPAIASADFIVQRA
ncbi:MAG TPA: CHAD domain-containing protein [Nitrospiraceae bacterium]|nr:CHAD domain-containing protein [Nitrospiraceae bacterium]